MGHKRLALETGEDPVNIPIEYVLESIKTIYSIKHKNGAIRRVNVNIAATTVENYKKLKDVGIGTYILFQETYGACHTRTMSSIGEFLMASACSSLLPSMTEVSPLPP